VRTPARGGHPLNDPELCGVHTGEVYCFFLWLSGPNFDIDRDRLEQARP
jgi:hypothetical protein